MSDKDDYGVNEDWEATCLIYDGDPSIRTKNLPFSQVLQQHPDRVKALFGDSGAAQEEAATASNSAMLCSIEISGDWSRQQTTIFAHVDPLHPDCYRFWSVDAAPPVRLQIWFLYRRNFPGSDNEDKYGENDKDEDGFPAAVRVYLACNYSETWPLDDKEPWVAWLNEKATEILEEQYTSYSVCNFVDHNALGYFNVIPLDDAQQAVTLVLFDKAATHWQNTVDSLVYNPTSGCMIRHFINGTKKKTNTMELWGEPQEADKEQQLVHCHQQKKQSEKSVYGFLHPAIILKKEKWFPETCPICFDEFTEKDMVRLECSHLVCQDCFTIYCKLQVRDIQQYRQHDLPFRCPVEKCRRGIPVIGMVKQFLNKDEMDQVRTWYKNLTRPVSKALPKCLDCAHGTMRREHVSNFWVYCENCDVVRCEYCIAKLKNISSTTDSQHLATKCLGAQTLKLARRYLRASPEIQQNCEELYPWIKDYAEARVTSVKAIKEWMESEQGQVCPNCSNGVVRTAGCFHIQCRCGTHFCYECGEELFPPYYGTHHCWEKR